MRKRGNKNKKLAAVYLFVLELLKKTTFFLIQIYYKLITYYNFKISVSHCIGSDNMSQQFEQDDIVWCPNQASKFWPAKIKADPESGEWKKDEEGQVFVELFHTGKGRTPKGKWQDIKELVSFESSPAEPEFECQKLTKVYSLAKTATKSKDSGRRTSIKLERCSTVAETATESKDSGRRTPIKLERCSTVAETSTESKDSGRRTSIKRERRSTVAKTANESKDSGVCPSIKPEGSSTVLPSPTVTPAPKKRGRPAKSTSQKSKSTSKKNEARGVFAQLGNEMAFAPKQLNVEVSDNEVEEEVDEVDDDDIKAKMEKEFKNFLDELDSDEDEDTENDGEWNPKSDKENKRPSGRFVFKKARKPLGDLEPMVKDEKSDYEKIQVF